MKLKFSLLFLFFTNVFTASKSYNSCPSSSSCQKFLQTCQKHEFIGCRIHEILKDNVSSGPAFAKFEALEEFKDMYPDKVSRQEVEDAAIEMQKELESKYNK